MDGAILPTTSSAQKLYMLCARYRLETSGLIAGEVVAQMRRIGTMS